MDKIKLFCFPYAGGSALVFNKWKKYLAPEITLVPVELAGRGSRVHEAFYKNVEEAIEDSYSIIKPQIEDTPYALFGHSMGGTIAYRLAKRIKKQQHPSPVHIFFSARRPPHVKRIDEKLYHLMDDNEFKKEVVKLGGTPQEFFDYPELAEFFLPLLKNDFRIIETEATDTEIIPLNQDISVLLGKEDDQTTEAGEGWRLHTDKLCHIHLFDGGHFFLHSKTEQVVELINTTLLDALTFGIY